MIQDKTLLSIERALMHGIQEMVFIVRVDDNGLFYEFVNQAAMDKTDLDHTSIGKTFFETQTYELADMINSQYLKVLESNGPITYEDSYTDPEGILRYSKTCLTPMFDSDGKCTHVVSIVQDITGEVEAKQESVDSLKNLEESRSYYHSLFEHNADAILTLDLNGQIKGANPMGLKVSQLPKEEFYEKRILDFVAPEDKRKTLLNFQKAKNEEYINFRVNVLQNDNKMLSVLVKFIPIKIREVTTGFYVILKDMRELDHMVELYMEVEKNFRVIAENANDVIILINHEKQYLFISPSIEELYGFTPNEYLGINPLSNIHPDDAASLYIKLSDAKKHRAICKMRIRIKHKFDHWVWSELHATPVFDESHSYSHMVIIVRDVSLQKKYETELEFLAYHDPLTSLPNRRFFQEALEKALSEYHKKGVKFAVMLLDIDKFKSINDQWGHETGDVVIREFSNRLKAKIHKTDVVARLGGDEFIILLPDVDSENCALSVMDKIRQAMRYTWEFENTSLSVMTSIGMTMPNKHSTISSILKEADKAMYVEKKSKIGNDVGYRF
ncbi:diguanylate cyclase domain-containing protein [Sporosarcina siberiensis]|uniref:Diguanylate cyclase domain-containing protein n=1 Tax=Sporosarcina siberiensis TaxID=1365606 RepID=A0ABW4SDK3_9BACL